MKRFKLKRFNSGLILFIILLYLEIVFRFFNKISIFNISMIYVILFDIFFTIILNIINRLFNKKVNKIIYYVLLFILSLIFAVQLCIYKMFGFYFDWSLIGAIDQVASFTGDGISLIISNILGVLLLFLPFIILIILRQNVVIEKIGKKEGLIKIIIGILIYGLFMICININKENVNSYYKLYYKINNVNLNIKKFGVINTFIIDTKRSIFGFEDNVLIVPKDDEETSDNYEYNNLNIDFDELIKNEKDEIVLKMHKYFKNESGTKQNEYTNYFEGKNLVLFMAESFNEIAVRENLTPTLYKLVNSGFVFDNFYTPTISSTIGGEFQELSGLVAASGFLSPWKEGSNSYPFGIGKIFNDLGYNTHAYHNHYYTFQNRNKYLKALGFDNYKGCRNGLEKSINCHIWPESDVEMINATVNDYLYDKEPFFTYYVTVSGHGGYSFSQSAMAHKHKDDVKHLSYSEKPLAYLAAQMELDKALELLIKKLEEAGKLDNTVIALVGDHYPYYLSLDEVNEIASYKKDSTVEINKSNFILWNNKMDTVHIEKVGSQIDVLPTIYNLFGISYDSRIIIGKDILSTNPGLAIFGNSSWVSDKGTYFANSEKFVPKDGENIDYDYVSDMNDVVASKIAMSKYIMTKDYYRKILR